MKHFYYKTTLLLCLVALSSCSDEREGVTLTGNAATFTPLISGLEPIAGSRASGGDWQVNDRVGVFMLASGDDTFPALANNCEYFATASGGNTALLPVSSSQTIYYPMDDSGVTFMAYYPYTSSLGDDETNPVYAVDLTDQSSLEDLDLLYHKGTAVYSNALPNATLNFEHQLVKMEISVVRGTGIDTPLTDMAIKLKGMSATADFELATGKLANEGDVADIVPGTLSATTDEGYYAAILLPQDAVEGREIAFSLGSLSYFYELPADLDFEKGKIYTLAFAFGEAEVTFMGVTIRDWATATPIDGYTVSLYDKEYFFSKELYERNSLIIMTDYPVLPFIRFSDNDGNPDAGVAGNWLSQSVTASPDEPTYYKVGTEDGIHTYELLFDVAANGSTERKAYIHITIGSRSMVVPVDQSDKDIMSYVYKQPESNCYIVHPGGVGIAIPVTRANMFWQSADGDGTEVIGAATPFEAELIWTDIKGNNDTGIAPDACVKHIMTYGTGKDGYIIVLPGTQEGNASVAVKVNDEIKWSWHIWVTAYNPWVNDNPTNPANGVVFMDRNLGTTNVPGRGVVVPGSWQSYGLFYQWGRKDPFVGKREEGYGSKNEPTLYAETTSTINVKLQYTGDVNTTTIVTSVLNPDVFYYPKYVDGTYDWLAVRNDELWGGATVVYKTLYDPCPVGWRVPAFLNGAYPWTGIETSDRLSESWTIYEQYGVRLFPGNKYGEDSYQYEDYYPAAGSRGAAGGALFMVDYSGNYWGASPRYRTYGYESGGAAMYFNTVVQSYGGFRANGFSVRCVKE